jgi:5-methyltetrahydropteroyltriglutamate--homocysteine methyltransferase
MGRSREETIVVKTAVLGFPRIGADRELKRALERYWSGGTSLEHIEQVAQGVRHGHLDMALEAGVDVIPSNDFSLYDHVLDTAVMVGAVPERFAPVGGSGPETYFAMARGGARIRPLEMTKWLDTNYHYLVPEIGAETNFHLDGAKPLAEFREALAWGTRTRPVLLGPLSFLLLTKSHEAAPPAVTTMLDRLLPIYEQLLVALAEAGATEVQIDEPCLVTDRDEMEIVALERSWARLTAASPALELTLATYFGGLGSWLDRILALPAAEFHLDLVRAPEQLETAVTAISSSARLSLGVVDGRNVWIADLGALLTIIEPVVERLGERRVRLAPSCSLLHVPYSAARENHIDARVRPWLAFAHEKLLELRTLAAGLGADATTRRELLADNQRALASRRESSLTHDASVAQRLGQLGSADFKRRSTYPQRAMVQAEQLALPVLPTTTIGSFPQTREIRDMRRRAHAAEVSTEEYESFLRDEIRSVIDCQEKLGLDVFVHGEAERNDMVQYFAEHLDGFAISMHGWVQSYGSRCVKPPILFGDVSRPEPITVRWWEHAQSCTTKPVKGMLTGPVTVLQWSFVRDDQPRAQTCLQIALAMRAETLDLEHAGAKIIQIDEAALREGLPLRRSDQGDYLRWAVDCFRLAANGVMDATQLHSHMCYSEFNEMIEHIARMDADVISIEASRSEMDLLDAFHHFRYPNAVGPGVYDIHSPRVPSTDEIEAMLCEVETRIPRERLWVNPDCGLKTRGWAEVVPALEHLVAAAHRRRAAVPIQV